MRYDYRKPQQDPQPKPGSILTDYLTGGPLHEVIALAARENEPKKKVSRVTRTLEHLNDVHTKLSDGLTRFRSFEKAMHPKTQLPTVAAGWSGQVAFYKAECEQRREFLSDAFAACRSAGLKPGDDARQALATVAAPDGGLVVVRKPGGRSSVVNLSLNGAGVDVFRKITARDVEENYAKAMADVKLAGELESFAREVEATSDDEIRVAKHYVQALRNAGENFPEAVRKRWNSEVRRIENSFGVSK